MIGARPFVVSGEALDLLVSGTNEEDAKVESQGLRLPTEMAALENSQEA